MSDSCKLLKRLERETGIEPATSSLVTTSATSGLSSDVDRGKKTQKLLKRAKVLKKGCKLLIYQIYGNPGVSFPKVPQEWHMTCCTPG